MKENDQVFAKLSPDEVWEEQSRIRNRRIKLIKEAFDDMEGERETPDLKVVLFDEEGYEVSGGGYSPLPVPNVMRLYCVANGIGLESPRVIFYFAGPLDYDAKVAGYALYLGKQWVGEEWFKTPYRPLVRGDRLNIVVLMCWPTEGSET